ncbi:oligosaccharide flippase family protein [Echinicola vietnamensis]|uniref:Membrane protein involved in the export of O-antigen and teichoic acid n=1 Tax=Echinicola vietnamensis (strain DSM 17526 / LMG 23754 / KMM 6221) TaxID=926556 RepID=L0G2Z6_ECHVK|nr:oligosaccharide flippase family protein [Echinicola vietnamensis]AGA80579.1 membrane protein involved in the export of O-antigen and teichoic acid [Echinicola vietnamensis DSM 17526]
MSKSSYFRLIANQAIYVIIAQLIPVICSPILTRVYDENGMAEVTGLVSLCSILIVASTGKLENALVLEKNKGRIKDVLGLNTLFAFIFFVIVFALVFIFKDFLVRSFKLNHTVYLVPFYVLFYAFFNILNYWFIREKKFTLKAISKIVESIIYVALALLVAKVFGRNEFGLAIGKITGVIIGCLFLFLKAKSSLPVVKYNFKSMKNIFLKYKDFPLHNVPSNMINIVGIQLIVVFLGIYYTKEEVGYFGLANMIVVLPVSFVAQTISNIFFEKVVESFKSGKVSEVKSTFLNTLGILLLFGIPVFLTLKFYGEDIIVLIFGKDWEISGKVVEIISLVFISQILVSPLGIILVGINKIKLNAYWQYGRFILMVFLLFIGADLLRLDYFDLLFLYSIGVLVSYVFYLVIIFKSVFGLGK